MTRLRVLVTEAEPGAADCAVRELTDAGHEVVRCCEADTPAFPCAALRDGICPLDGTSVDLALTARRHPRAQPTAREQGAMCAIRHHVPLVVAGPAAFDPFEQWEREVLDRSFDVVEACERTARAPLPVHTRLAADAADAVLARAQRDVPLLLAVHREHGRLVVQLRTPSELPPGIRNMIGTRIVAGLREYDRDASGIDVAFGRLGGDAA